MGKPAWKRRRKMVKRLVEASKRLYLADVAEPPVWESQFWTRVDDVIAAALDLDKANNEGATQ